MFHLLTKNKKNYRNAELITISNGLLEIDLAETLQKITEKFEPIHKKVSYIIFLLFYITNNFLKEEVPIVLPKIKTPSKQSPKESYFTKITHEMHKAANFLLK